MRLSIRRDLGLQLLTLYLLFVGPVVIASLALDRLASKRLEADVKATDLALARAIAQETNTIMDNALQAIQQFGAYPEVIAADSAGMEKLFHNLMSSRPDVNLVYRLDSSGLMLYHYPPGPGSTVGQDFSFRDYFQRAKNTRSPIFSEGRISPTTQQPVATAVMPLWNDEGRFLGLVATNIKLQGLSDTLASIAAEHHPEEAFQVIIIDSAARVIAHPDPRNLLIELGNSPPQVTQAVLSGQSANIVGQDGNGEETLFSFVPIPSAGWGVIVSRPTAAAFATLRATHRGVLLTVSVFLIVGMFFWVALSQRVIRPLEQLARFSQMIGPDRTASVRHYQPLQELSKRADQIGHLSHSLILMEQSIQARLDELSTLLETSAEVVSTLESQAVLERILEQVERLLGIEKSIIVALDQEKGVFRARASRGMSERYVRSLEISPDEVTSVTMRAIRVGEPIQVSDTETDPSFTVLRPRARAEGYRSMAAIPLKTTHAPPSALNVYSPQPQVLNERELDLLSTFANQAAMAIENAELYARSDTRLQEQTRRLEALIQSLEVGLILEDLKGCVLYTNRMVSELSGMPVDEVIGYPVDNLYQRLSDRAVNRKDARDKMNLLFSGSGTQQEAFTLPLEYPDGPRYIRLKGFTVSDAKGVEIGRGQILQDITREYEIDRMKTSLVSTVSHELRTPLASIKGYASTLLAEDIDWELPAQREFLSIILRDVDRLSDMVNDLLDMSRIETGSLILSKTACGLKDIIVRGVERVDGGSERPVHIDIPTDLLPVYVDAHRIEIVIRNLVENAIKYSEDGKPINIRAIPLKERVIVYVEDQGPGIPPEKADDIFESFYRLDNGLARRKPGVGLGLAICRGIVQAHGGEIWVEPGHNGSCFTFSIPMINTEGLEGLFHE